MIPIAMRDPSQVGVARRQAGALAAAQGFSETDAGRLALVVSELATNLLKHADGGQILLDAHAHGIDVLSLDSGPGIADVAASLADGYSTAGTLGHGLGAARRLSQSFEIISWPTRGTIVFAQLRRAEAPAPADAPLGAVSVAKEGEEVCGDAWSTHADDAGHRVVFMVDGLGHGPLAAQAAHQAVRQFESSWAAPPATVIEAVHHALKPTRGGAVAVARIDRAAACISFAGLGNIAALTVGEGGRLRRLVSHNGTAGHNARRIQAFDYPCAPGLLVMHSDGLDTRWSLDRYPGLMRAHPMLIAAVLYRDHARGRDDASVVVTRLP